MMRSTRIAGPRGAIFSAPIRFSPIRTSASAWCSRRLREGVSDLLLRPIVAACRWQKDEAVPYVERHQSRGMMNSTDQFEAIVREHYEALFRFALSLARAESDAWDLTQQTFYAWAMKGHQLRDASRVKTWLFTTLHRAFLVARKRQTRFSEERLEDVLQQLTPLTA